MPKKDPLLSGIPCFDGSFIILRHKANLHKFTSPCQGFISPLKNYIAQRANGLWRCQGEQIHQRNRWRP